MKFIFVEDFSCVVAKLFFSWVRVPTNRWSSFLLRISFAWWWLSLFFGVCLGVVFPACSGVMSQGGRLMVAVWRCVNTSCGRHLREALWAARSLAELMRAVLTRGAIRRLNCRMGCAKTGTLLADVYYKFISEPEMSDLPKTNIEMIGRLVCAH